AAPQKVPPEVTRFLQDGARGRHPETLKYTPKNVSNIIIGNNQLALEFAQRKALELGFRVQSLGSAIAGDTTKAAAEHAKIASESLAGKRRDQQPICLLSGGETTVDLTHGHGKGGRNQEFALSMSIALPRALVARATILAGGTDGEDGPTDA